jgi:hypothetical protein
MVCRSTTIVGNDRANVAWTNWAGTATRLIDRCVEPASLQELVEIVAQATEQDRHIHPLGSGWAFEDLAVAEWVVNLRSLVAQLSYVTDSALTDEWAVRQAAPDSDQQLFHVEGGIEIGSLNEMLTAQGLAMISLGGANGQTLVGAIATSTHGGDVALGPLPELVYAVHLVTDGGREIWLERASRPITTDARLRTVMPCGETEIIRDDAIFNSALVAVGRFGVIYSVVIGVRPQYRLAEWTVEVNGADALRELRSGVEAGAGLLPLLESLPAPPAALDAEDGDVASSARFVQVLFNSKDPEQCFVTRRWPTSSATDLNLDFAEPFPCNPGEPQAVLNFAAEALRVASGALAAIPIVGIVWAGQAVLAAHGLNLLAEAVPPVSGGTAVAASLNAAWDNHLGRLTPEISRMVLSSRFAASAKEGRRGASDLVMTGTRQGNQSTCFRADSSESVFAASTDNYLQFLDRILPASPNFHQSGIISLRFSAPAEALLSMHNWPAPMVVSIETASLAGLRDNRAWLELVQRAALDCGGRMHWGQINELTEDQVLNGYGSNLTKWSEALFAVSGTSSVFSNEFTRKRGLEPRGWQPMAVQRLVADQALTSSNGLYSLIYQSDGNLVLYGPGGGMWASNTSDTRPGVCIMQSDGNLVIYDPTNTAVWASATDDPGSRLVVQNDGNVVIYRPDGSAAWDTGTFLPMGPSATGDDMVAGETLLPGQGIRSGNDQYLLTYQTDGNLVLYGPGGATWASNTSGTRPGVCIMQSDGNCVVYEPGALPAWASATDGNPGSRLVVQDDGQVAIYRPDGTPIWVSR